MSLLQRLLGAFSPPAPEPPAQPPAAGRFREAASPALEEAGWRRLTDDAQRDLLPMTQERMRELAAYLWEANPLANRIIELPVAYQLAEGWRITHPDPEAQRWLDLFEADPINLWRLKFPERVRALALFGEQAWPVFVNPMNGHTRLGYLDPAFIQDVIADPEDATTPVALLTKQDSKGRYKKYRVAYNAPESIFGPRARAIREACPDGDCFYFAVNKLAAGQRGRSDLLSLTDWLDAYDRILFGEGERAEALRAFVWSVSLAGATKEEVEARCRDIAPPKPGAVRVHNDREVWTAVTPDLQAADASTLARLLRNHILGGATIPEHWIGGGGDVNRSTGDSMGEPTLKVWTMRQTVLRHMLVEVGTWVIHSRLDPSRRSIPDPGDLGAGLEPPTVDFPEMSPQDNSRYAAALQQVASAALLVAAAAARLGVEYDPAEALATAEAEAKTRRQSQAESDLPPPPEPQDLRRAAQEAEPPP